MTEIEREMRVGAGAEEQEAEKQGGRPASRRRREMAVTRGKRMILRGLGDAGWA